MQLSVFIRTFKGYRFWKRIVKQNKIDLTQDFLFVIPKGEGDVSYYSVKYINNMISKFEKDKNWKFMFHLPIVRRNEDFYIITDDEELADNAKEICRRVTKTIILRQEEVRMIIESYCMFPYSDRLYIGAVNHLQARGGLKALSSIGLYENEVVANGILYLDLNSIY